MNRNRLQHLITVLENVPAEHFDLNSWHCGTTACAIGHACLDPEFQEQGLHLSSFGSYTLVPVFGPHARWNATCEFFDLDWEQAEHLFSELKYPSGAKPADVINRIKEMLQ